MDGGEQRQRLLFEPPEKRDLVGRASPLWGDMGASHFYESVNLVKRNRPRFSQIIYVLEFGPQSASVEVFQVNYTSTKMYSIIFIKWYLSPRPTCHTPNQ